MSNRPDNKALNVTFEKSRLFDQLFISAQPGLRRAADKGLSARGSAKARDMTATNLPKPRACIPGTKAYIRDNNDML